MAKRIPPLSDTQIKHLKPEAKEFIKADGNNLAILVKPNGAKLWRFIYTHPTTKKRIKASLGKYPAISLATARETARQFQALLASGLDPFEEAEKEVQKQESEAMTLQKFAPIWREWKAPSIKARTDVCEYRRLELHLFPLFGDVPLAQFDLQTAVKRLEPLHRAKPDTARKIINSFVAILDYAVIRGLLAQNPLALLKQAFHRHEAKNQPTIAPDALPRFLHRLELANCLITTKLLIEWPLLTMVRPAEAVSAEWAEIDMVRAEWHIPAEKMKGRKGKTRPHVVPLSRQALAVLDEMRKHNGHRKHVFASRINPREACNSQTANNAIKNITGFKGKLTAHGLRSVASTYLNEQGEEPHVIDACLAHTTGSSVAQVYNRSTYLTQRRTVMQKWGDYVQQCKKY